MKLGTRATTDSRRATRQGFALFAVVAIVAVCLMVLGYVVRQVISDSRQCRLRHEQRQCRRMAEAGAERAALLRAADAEYNGETWTIAADDLGLSHDAAVAIGIDSEVVAATAAYPAGDSPRVRHTQRHPITPTTP